MCNCCQSFTIPCIFCDYECCNSIITQFDYKRNNVNFYTQGHYIQSGCYFCRCLFCQTFCFCCCSGNLLHLRENLEPDNPDFNVGVKKGSTLTAKCCGDIFTTYTSQEGLRGPTIKLQCCEYYKNRIVGCGYCYPCPYPCPNPCPCSYCCNCGNDVEIIIEDANAQQAGTITLFNGNCSKKVEGMCCYDPGRHYLINFPPNASSIEKFKIIADLIHFNSKTGLL